MAVAASTVTETVEVRELEVACDGGSPALGHPKVYLHVNKTSRDVVCPYCSRRFVLAADVDPHAPPAH